MLHDFQMTPDEDVTNNNPTSSNKKKTHFCLSTFFIRFPSQKLTKTSFICMTVNFRLELGHSIGKFAALLQPLWRSYRLRSDEKQ